MFVIIQTYNIRIYVRFQRSKISICKWAFYPYDQRPPAHCWKWRNGVCRFNQKEDIFKCQTCCWRTCAVKLTQLNSMHALYMRLSAWWRHQMETVSALLVICAGNSPVTGEFPAQRPVTRSFDVFFDLRLNKRLSKNRKAGDLRRHHAHYDVIVMRTRKRFPYHCPLWGILLTGVSMIMMVFWFGI